MCDRVLFVERSSELRWLARLRTKGPEPEGNQVLRGRHSQSEYQAAVGQPVIQPRRPNSRLDKVRHMFQKVM